MRIKGLCAAAAAVGWLASVAAGEIAHTDGPGRVQAMSCDGEFAPVFTDARVALRGWKGYGSLEPWNVRDVVFCRNGERREWRGRLKVGANAWCGYLQTIEERNGAAHLTLQLVAEQDLDLEGAYLELALPVDGYARGMCEARDTGRGSVSARLPAAPPAEPRFFAASTRRLTFAAPDGLRILDVAFPRERSVLVQDERAWGPRRYTMLARFLEGGLARGESASMSMVLRMTGLADRTPAVLWLDAERARYRFEGVGGNYVFGLDSPVVDYSLEHLRIAWARVGMTLVDWEPVNDNESAEAVDWGFYEGQDRPGSRLREEFLLAAELQRRGIPFIASVWYMPAWLYVDPGRGRDEYGRRIAPDKWAETLECLGTYLLHAKRRYGIEPDLFSFNESREGVRVLLSATEHRDMIRRVGRHFEKLGLKTRMLLADNGSARGTHTYALPTVADPEAMRFVGALSTHTWHGAAPEEWQAWGELAERTGLPLLIGEMGTDSSAWQTRWVIQTFHYALNELALWQDLLLYARPQAVLTWELTSDYRTVREVANAAGDVRLEPLWRFRYLQHFGNLTPPGAEGVAVKSDHPLVRFTAFRAPGKSGGRRYVLHAANLGAAREAGIFNVPPGVETMRVTATGEHLDFADRGVVSVRDGRLSLRLPGQTLVTLVGDAGGE